jgi:hypothetical protein
MSTANNNADRPLPAQEKESPSALAILLSWVKEMT